MTGLDIDNIGENKLLMKISKVEGDIDRIMQNQSSIFGMINEKGLEVGMPRRIRDDIKELIGYINKLDRVWENREQDEKRKNLDNDVARLINKGDVTSAFLKVAEELRVYREDMVGVRMFLNLITFKLNHLENELTKHEKK